MMKLINSRTQVRIAVQTLLLVATTASVPAQAAERDIAYTMTVISDDSFGQYIVDGAYEKAISKISDTGPRRLASFEAQTNLCVAYTKSGDLERAEPACDNSVAAIRKLANRAVERRSTPEHIAYGYRRYLALALANRGVLHAVHGDHAQAREFFLRADELGVRRAAPVEVNLARLDLAN